MPHLSDRDEIRRVLRRDPGWCVYALGDLAPAMFPKTTWFTPDLTLVVRDYGTAILFAMGAGSVREALDSVEGQVHLQVQREALDAIRRHADVSSVQKMRRMVWTGRPTPVPSLASTRLSLEDVPAIRHLYADGRSTAEAPDFFHPSMVDAGVFHGIHEGAALVAVAGTHLVAREEGVASIGNVYTRRDRRGRGLGRAVVQAVLSELVDIETVGLNVRADNRVALTLYESLGFADHCEFYEAIRPATTVPRHSPAAS